MQNLLLPSSNIFEEKAQNFENTKLSKRLTNKYKPKPFESKYKRIFYISLFTSYLCNLFSILTASTFVFTYIFSIVTELPYPVIIASVFTLAVLVIIETLQRSLSPQFFKGILQYGYKLGSTVLVVFILSLSSLSVYFSYSGGYDLVNTLSTPPILSEPKLNDIGSTRAEYKTLIAEAGKDAENYKQSKLWRGRLSDNNAKVYRELLGKKNKLQTAMLSKINKLEDLNLKATATAQSNYRSSLLSYEAQNITKGGGLAKFTIIAQAIFFLSIFFMEFYDYRTATQYALVPGSTTLSSPQINSPLLAQMPPIVNNTLETKNRPPIGFKTDVEPNKKTQSRQIVNTKTATDKHTIEHNGKRYSLKEVNNFVQIYQKRYLKAMEEDKTEVAENRGEKLRYWLDKRKFLLTKNIDQ